MMQIEINNVPISQFFSLSPQGVSFFFFFFSSSLQDRQITPQKAKPKEETNRDRMGGMSRDQREFSGYRGGGGEEDPQERLPHLATQRAP